MMILDSGLLFWPPCIVWNTVLKIFIHYKIENNKQTVH